MNTFQKVMQSFALVLLLVMSGPHAYAEDIEVYLVSQETEGANILILIDNAGSTHTNYAAGTAPGGTKYFDEIAYAMKQVVGSVTNAARIGVSSQHAGGTTGGYINYPIRDLTIGSEDPLQFFTTGVAAEASQAVTGGVDQGLDVADATITFPTTGTGAATDTEKLGVIVSNVSIPRYAKITSASLMLGLEGSPIPANTEATVLVQVEVTPSPADFSLGNDIEGRVYLPLTGVKATAKFFSSYVQVGTASGGDLSALIQQVVNDPAWCGGSISIVVDGSDIKDTVDIQVNTLRNAAPTTTEVNRLEILWDPNDSTQVPVGQKSCLGAQSHTLAETTDDATEKVDNGTLLDLDASELSLYTKTKGSPASLGPYNGAVRFAGLPYGPSDTDTDLLSAKLYVTVNAATGGNLNVAAIGGDTGAFATAGDITAYKNKSVVGTVSQAAAIGEMEVDVTTIVQAAMNSGTGWAERSALGFILSADAGQQIDVHASEGGAASTVRLVMDLLASSPGAFAPTRRAELNGVIDQMAASNGGGNAKPHNTYVESARYIIGAAPAFEAGLSHDGAFTDASRSLYLSPNQAGECSSNHVVLVNHSEANQEANSTAVTALTKGSCPASAEVELPGVDTNGDGIADSFPTGAVNAQWACSGALAAWLKDSDTSGLSVPVTTHTVAFAPNKDETLYGMQYVAEQGGGQFLQAANADELAAALQQIIDDVTISNASLAAPGVAVNQLNRFRHLDQLFYGVFAPSVNTRWEGNLKRYRLAPGPQIVDENNDPAVDLDTGFFKEDSDSWWGAAPDGPTVVFGGAREELANRKLYVADSTPGTGSATANSKAGSTSTLPYTIGSNFGTIDETKFGYTAAERADFEIAFENILLKGWGDPLHSEPRLTNFGFKGTSLEAAAADPNLQKNLVFVSTNDGLIHAIDPIDGSERWAFTPAEEALKLRARGTNAKVVDQKRSTYGMDGSMTFWRRGDGSTGVQHVLLYAGQRRGGRNYYGLDVTDAYSGGAPGLMWVIQGGDSGFKKLGQTWSAPVLAQVKVDGVATPVLIFTGGYDTTTHDVAGAVNTSGDSLGNAIYIVNAWSGGLIWSASDDLTDGAQISNKDMKWSMPASPAVVDRDFDGLVDHIYAADTAGQIFRVDINNSNTAASDLAYRVKTFAQLGITESSTDIDSVVNNRKFFAQPVVGSNDRGNGYILQIGLGSGNRVYPTNMDTDDRIFLLDDAEAINAMSTSLVPAAPLTSADLLDVTTEADSGNFDASTHKGWYINLEDNGEKSVSSGAIVDGKLIMTAYLPDTAIKDCTRVIGLSRLYTFDVLDGSGPPDTPRSKDVQLPGLSPNVNVTVNANENGTSDLTVIVGTQVEYGGEADAGRLSKTRWYEVESKAQADQVILDAKAVAP